MRDKRQNAGRNITQRGNQPGREKQSIQGRPERQGPDVEQVRKQQEQQAPDRIREQQGRRRTGTQQS